MATAEAETSQDEHVPPEGLVYDGFISYSHAADDLLAPRLQAGLQRFAKPWWKRRACRGNVLGDIVDDELGRTEDEQRHFMVLRHWFCFPNRHQPFDRRRPIAHEGMNVSDLGVPHRASFCDDAAPYIPHRNRGRLGQPAGSAYRLRICASQPG